MPMKTQREREAEQRQAKLERIQEQVELIRDGLAISSDPMTLSRRIDTIGDTLGSTTQWIKQQQELFGPTEEFLSDPGPVLTRAGLRIASSCRALDHGSRYLT